VWGAGFQHLNTRLEQKISPLPGGSDVRFGFAPLIGGIPAGFGEIVETLS
jgi:hypothetical protein